MVGTGSEKKGKELIGQNQIAPKGILIFFLLLVKIKAEGSSLPC